MKLNKPIIYLITEGKATVENFSEQKANILEIVKIASENEISLIQIREKHLPAKLVFELTAEAVKITNKTETKLLVNDRADIALAAKPTAFLTELHCLRNHSSKFPKGFYWGFRRIACKAEIAMQQEAVL